MHKMCKINLHCPKCMFKGKLLNWQCWRRPIAHLKWCHFLILCSILRKNIAYCAKRIVCNNNTHVLCRYVEICRKIKTALPVYFLVPLSIYLCEPSRSWSLLTHLILRDETTAIAHLSTTVCYQRLCVVLLHEPEKVESTFGVCTIIALISLRKFVCENFP